MQVVKLSQKHINLIQAFCNECKDVGYQNNASLEAMKWGEKYDLPHIPHFWGLIVNDELASISGCHSLGEFDPNFPQMRCLFRSATLPRYANLIPGISKNHMNSIPFSILLPYQLVYGIENDYEHFFITTSHGEHDASGKMNRTHKAISLLAKRGIVNFVDEELIYSTPQTKWEIDLFKYWRILKSFDQTRQSLGIKTDKDYKKIKYILDSIKPLGFNSSDS